MEKQNNHALEEPLEKQREGRPCIPSNLDVVSSHHRGVLFNCY